MKEQQFNSTPNAPSERSANIMFVALLSGAAMIAALGTILPILMEFTGTEALIMRCAFYVAALGDVILAFWIRAKARKRQSSGPAGGGAVRRQ